MTNSSIKIPEVCESVCVCACVCVCVCVCLCDVIVVCIAFVRALGCKIFNRQGAVEISITTTTTTTTISQGEGAKVVGNTALCMYDSMHKCGETDAHAMF